MNKSILWLIGLLFAASCTIVSCSESDGAEDPYANWEERNQKYIDSIAVVAKANEGNEPGKWKIIRSYKLPPLGLNETPNVNDYVYAKILENGDGATSLFNDTTGVNYRGKFITGTVFDQSFLGTFDPKTATPSFSPSINSQGYVSDWGTGAKTAVMAMRVGDIWEIYIPSDLAYGASGYGSIPGYSTLIFFWNLAKVIPLKGHERSLDISKE